MSEKNAEKQAWLEAISFEKRVQTGQIAVDRIKLADFADKFISDYANKDKNGTLNKRREIYSTIIFSIEEIA